MRSIDVPEVGDLAGMTAHELEAALHRVELVRRQAETMAAEIIAEADRTGAYQEDGHRSAFAWARATCNWSATTAKAAVQTARLFVASRQIRDAATQGTLGVDQLRALAGLWANPRSRPYFPDSAAFLLADAQKLWFDDLMVVARRWESLADEDGAHAAHARAFAQRDARLSMVGDELMMYGRGGVLAGAEMIDIFDRFRDAEFSADWERGVDVHGDAMCASLMQRTDRQRRFDALQSIFRAAATSGVAGNVQPTVNVVVDLDTLEHHVMQACGAEVAPLDPTTVHARRCETDTGHRVDPTDIVAAVMVGHLRRVVLDSAGVVTDLGRKRRLFTAGARDAVRLGDRVCGPDATFAPGAARPITAKPGTRADRPTLPTAVGVAVITTASSNAATRPGRDPTGRWHIVRPDGTEVGYFGLTAAAALSWTGS